jgi:hypothetical protein
MEIQLERSPYCQSLSSIPSHLAHPPAPCCFSSQRKMTRSTSLRHTILVQQALYRNISTLGSRSGRRVWLLLRKWWPLLWVWMKLYERVVVPLIKLPRVLLPILKIIVLMLKIPECKLINFYCNGVVYAYSARCICYALLLQ